LLEKGGNSDSSLCLRGVPLIELQDETIPDAAVVADANDCTPIQPVPKEAHRTHSIKASGSVRYNLIEELFESPQSNKPVDQLVVARGPYQHAKLAIDMEGERDVIIADIASRSLSDYPAAHIL
jgi:hypothetical protein